MQLPEPEISLRLLVIPVIFTYVDDFGRMVKRLFKAEAAPPAATHPAIS